MAVAGEMDGCDLLVAILRGSPVAMEGRIVGEAPPGSWLHAGMDVVIALDPAGTAFRDGGIAGQGRIYEDRIEIDLAMGGQRLALPGRDIGGTGTAGAGMEGTECARLRFRIAAITQSLFRVKAVAVA